MPTMRFVSDCEMNLSTSLLASPLSALQVCLVSWHATCFVVGTALKVSDHCVGYILLPNFDKNILGEERGGGLRLVSAYWIVAVDE